MHVDESDARPLRTQAGIRSTAGRDLNTAMESQRTPARTEVISHSMPMCFLT